MTALNNWLRRSSNPRRIARRGQRDCYRNEVHPELVDDVLVELVSRGASED
jgi:hypothetical protein